MSQHFPKPNESSRGDMKIELELSNYATKDNLKDATGVDTSNLAAMSDLASLTAELNKIDTCNLKIVSADLSKLCYVVDNDVVKKLFMIN